MGRDVMTTFLFARPSFVEGAARILDFGDTLTEYNRSPSPEAADANALAADWNAVIGDLTRAFKEFEAKNGPKQRELTW